VEIESPRAIGLVGGSAISQNLDGVSRPFLVLGFFGWPYSTAPSSRENPVLVSITAVTGNYSSHDLAGAGCHAEIRLRGSLTINTKLQQPLQAILYPDSLEIELGVSRPFYFLPLRTASYELFSDVTSDYEDLAFHT
jgi:hypothetical protein